MYDPYESASRRAKNALAALPYFIVFAILIYFLHRFGYIQNK